MMLIDTPGTNDPDKKRQDKQIFNEFVNQVRSILMSITLGITCFVHCLMPGPDGRIRRSDIDSMVTLLLVLTSFYPETDPFKHPRICVLFNNVSLYPSAEKQ